MDSWSADQLKKMQLGGNAKLNAFLKQYGVEKNMDIKEKYNTRAAEFYREKLRASVEGREYTPPSPSEVGPPVSVSIARSNTTASPKAAATKRKDDEWGDWGDSEARTGSSAASSGFASRSEYTRAQLEASAAGKESFFVRKMQENASRPEGLPPSQGGKYVGFGSTPPPRPKAQGGVDDLSNLLSSTLTTVTKAAETAAKTATQAVKSGSVQLSQTLQERQVAETLSQNAKVIGEKATHAAQTGFAALSGLYAKVASTVEQAARQQGYAVDLGSQRAAAVASSSSLSNSNAAAGGGAASSGRWGDRSQYDPLGSQRNDSMQSDSGSGHGRQASARSTGAAAGKVGGFSGFDADEDGDGNGWGSGWGKEGSAASARSAAPAPVARSASKPASQTHKSKSTPNLSHSAQAEDDDEAWGKW